MGGRGRRRRHNGTEYVKCSCGKVAALVEGLSRDGLRRISLIGVQHPFPLSHDIY